MKVSIIIVNYNGLRYARNCVASILRWSPRSEIIIVDNGSTDGSVESLRKEFPQIRLIALTKNNGFGHGNNRGAEVATGNVFFFLNNDTLLTEDTPAVLAAYLERNSEVAACGPKLLNEDRTFQLSFGLDPSIKNERIVRRMQRRLRNGDVHYASWLEKRHADKVIDWATGAALMVRREVFEKIGGFDDRFFMYFEDADLCRRIRKAGFEIRYNPETSVVHLLGQSVKDGNPNVGVEYRRSQIYYYRKHRSPIALLLLRLYLALRPFIHRT